MTENQSLYFRVRTRHDWNASEAGKGSKIWELKQD